jgi:hypothetical protein
MAMAAVVPPRQAQDIRRCAMGAAAVGQIQRERRSGIADRRIGMATDRRGDGGDGAWAASDWRTADRDRRSSAGRRSGDRAASG